MAKFISTIAGAAMIGTGLFLEFVTFGASTPLTMFLISSGIGMVLTGIGTLLSKGPLTGTSTASRNPVAPWNVVYGRAKIGGVLIYFGQFGDNDKYLDLVFVLACHACKSVDALLFDGQRIQMSTNDEGGGPFVGSGDSFTPLQQTLSISHISRANDIVTVILLQDIPLLQAGDNVIIQNVTGDLTLNGTFPVAQILSQVYAPGTPGSVTFTYICGGAPAIVDNEGQVITTWPDYGQKIHMEACLGNHTATFPGMLNGTPSDGDSSNLIQYTDNPWTAEHLCLGRTVVFLRLHYSDTYFANGLPSISFLVSGKIDIYDPRTAATGYSENVALCIANYLTNLPFGFKAPYVTEVPYPDLIAAANVCDELSPLASGATEPRYSLNGTFPLSMKRGSVLQNLLTACGGRLTYTGGQFKIQPAAWQGVSLDLGAPPPTGFVERSAALGRLSLKAFDGLSEDPGNYGAQAQWGACNVINYAVLVAFKVASSLIPPVCVQAVSGIPVAPGLFHTWDLVIPAPTVAGNTLIVDVCFVTGYPLSGCTVTDDHGNIYKPVYAAHALGSASFIAVFVCPSGSGGSLTLTLTQSPAAFGGIFDFNDLAVTFLEYTGLAGLLPSGSWLPGDRFGAYSDPTGICDAVSAQGGQDENTIALTVATTGENELLHFVTALMPDCGAGAVTVTKSGGPGAALQILSIAAGPFRWRPKVSIRDLYNGVKGTYISPITKWQATDFPPYAQDTLHGYASGSPLYPEGDANMAADGGDRRWLDIQLPFTISPSMAQRLAKIELMRRRQQGTGTFMYNMALYQATSLDIVKMTLPLLGWTDKLLEISSHRFKLDKSQVGTTEVTLLGTEIDVQETDPSVYDWSTSEELSPQGYQQATMPTNVGTLDDLYTVNGT